MTILRILLSLSLAMVSTGPALAQVGTALPYNPRPTVSPYLNMLRGGNAAVNYYGIVRPQMQAAVTLQRLQMDQNALFLAQSLLSSPPPVDLTLAEGPPSTGHPVQFMNYSRYFSQTPARMGTLPVLSPRASYRR
jgi:hypothetical protein